METNEAEAGLTMTKKDEVSMCKFVYKVEKGLAELTILFYSCLDSLAKTIEQFLSV